MLGPKVSADGGSTAVGGDNNGNVVNVTAAPESTVNLIMGQQEVARELPSLLGEVIVFLSQQALSEYGVGPVRELPPGADEKLKYNNLSRKCQVIEDYFRYFLDLDRAYRGIEKQNFDARRLVIRKAARTYKTQLNLLCAQNGVKAEERLEYIKANAELILDAVVAELLADFKKSTSVIVHAETAELAISLVVADAVVECEILERPPHAVTA